MNRGGGAWTEKPELVERLKQMVATGLSFGKIARVLGNGLSRNACIGKARRLGFVTMIKPGQPRPPKSERQVKPRETKAPSLPMSAEPPLDPLRIPMMALEYSHCRWPLWSHDASGAPDYPHCGLPKSIGSYCSRHADIAFGPANVRAFHRAKAEASKLADIARNERKLGAA